MTFTITYGWWLLPFFITIASFAWSFWSTREEKKNPSGWIGVALVGWFSYGLATIITLVSWLIYFIIH
jgi:hypothetical protein